MTALLTIIVLLLVAIAIWQMTKIFELSQVNTDNSQVANDKDNKLNGYLMFGFLIFIYLITIYSFWAWGDVLLGTPASEHGPEYDSLMNISMALIFFVQIVTQALLHWFAYKYKGQKGKKALFYADNDKLEFIWTIIPVITLAGLIIYGLFTWTSLMDIDQEEGDPIIIELYAQQFNWKARYAGEDNVLGQANVRLIDMAKFGQLFLQLGQSADEEIISSSWIQKSTEMSIPFNQERSSGYGYLWWMRIINSEKMYYAAGYGGQYIMVVPTRALVVAITSSSQYSGAYGTNLNRIFYEEIIGSFSSIY